MEYNRVVKDLGGKTKDAFLKEVGKYFQVEEEGSCPVKPEKGRLRPVCGEKMVSPDYQGRV